jgi:hypothetical protein
MPQSRSVHLPSASSSLRPLSALMSILFIAMCSPVAAQINTGKITGIVTDSGGAVVPGATLRAINQETNVATAVPSQEAGSYLINFLIPGHYRVEAELSGFQRAIENNVEVTAGGTARIDFTMQVGEVHQSIRSPGSSELREYGERRIDADVWL